MLAERPALVGLGRDRAAAYAAAVRKFALAGYRKPPQVFCPIRYDDWQKVLEPYVAEFRSNYLRASFVV